MCVRVCVYLEIDGGSSKMLETCVHLDACSPVYNPCIKYVNLNSLKDVCVCVRVCVAILIRLQCEWAHLESRDRQGEGGVKKKYIPVYMLPLNLVQPTSVSVFIHLPHIKTLNQVS